MRRIFLGFSIAALIAPLAHAAAERTGAYDEFIAKQAAAHGVPERLVHRIVQRESRYNPRVVHNRCFGLMQIKYGTARSMGYRGSPAGLLDAHTNMTYAIPYLANAYRLAGGDEDRAVTLFAAGYYYTARQKQMLASLRTADSPPLTPESPEPPPSRAIGPFASMSNASPQQIAAAPPAMTQAPQPAASLLGPATAQDSASRAADPSEPGQPASMAQNATESAPSQAASSQKSSEQPAGAKGRARGAKQDATKAAHRAPAATEAAIVVAEADLAETRRSTAAWAEPGWEDPTQTVAKASGKLDRHAHNGPKAKSLAAAKPAPIRSAALVRAETPPEGEAK